MKKVFSDYDKKLKIKTVFSDHNTKLRIKKCQSSTVSFVRNYKYSIYFIFGKYTFIKFKNLIIFNLELRIICIDLKPALRVYSSSSTVKSLLYGELNN